MKILWSALLHRATINTEVVEVRFFFIEAGGLMDQDRVEAFYQNYYGRHM